MKSLCVFVVSLLLVLVAASAYPQFQEYDWTQDDVFGQRPSFPQRTTPSTNRFPVANNAGAGSTTTARTTVATTASPRYLACLQSCPTTSEYNPICGSDNINYPNNGRLNCAIQCGQSVVALRMGTCNPL